MKHKLLTALLVIASTLCLCFGVAACTQGGEVISSGGSDWDDTVRHDWQYEMRVEPTCTEYGHLSYYECRHCGKFYLPEGDWPLSSKEIELLGELEDDAFVTYDDVLVAPTGHDFGKVYDYVAPTCTEEGMLAHICCRNCWNYFDPVTMEQIPDNEVDIPSLGGHTYGDYVIGDGGHSRTCTVCGDREVESHQFGDYVADEEGRTRTCKCGEEERELHIYENGACTTCGYQHKNHTFTPFVTSDEEHAKTCTVCNKTERGAHSYFNGSCIVCSHAHENHAFGEWVETKEASCTEAGQHYHDCACGYRESEEIPMKGHKYVDCFCENCHELDPEAKKIELYLYDEDAYGPKDELYKTLYTNAEKGYKIELPKVSTTDTAYFDGWYPDKEYMDPLTGEEEYHEDAVLYARELPLSSFTYSVSNGRAMITKCLSTRSTAIVVPNDYSGYPITSIAPNAFQGMTMIRWVYLFSPLQEIGESAFRGCNSMQKVVLPDSLITIGDTAFINCSGLKNIKIGDRVASIGSSAFSGCTSLETVTMGSNVDTIKSYAFYNCSSLKGVYIRNLTFWCGGIDFGNSSANPLSQGATLYVDGEPLTNLVDLAGTEEIKDYAFYGYRKFIDITIPEYVTKIGAYAFCNCKDLQSVTIGKDVTNIEATAFKDCINLSIIYWNAENCQTVGDATFDAFEGCTGLTEVCIGSNVKSIPAKAFAGCTKLATVYYCGDAAGWKGISINSNNAKLLSATRYYLSQEAPTPEQWAESENWWYFDGNDLPAIWEKQN